jgi:hypothetical protein
MTCRHLLVLVLLLNGSAFLFAQQQVEGRIYSAATDSLIGSVIVYNKSQKLVKSSRRDGYYSVTAVEGDTLIFSATGFLSDTTVVQLHMLLTRYDVTLQLRIVTLQNVKVVSTYRQDSLQRRIDYRNIYKKQPGVTGFNAPADGFGVVLSPVSYFSKKAKNIRTLKKRLLKGEQDDYVDRSFPKEWVSRLTGLKDDSLRLFMYQYRPSYNFCRKTDRSGMLIYVNDKLKEFLKPKKSG